MPAPLPPGHSSPGGSSPLLASSLQELASQPDGQIDVALGAALIAKDVYPEVEPRAILRELDEMSAPLFRERLEEKSSLEQVRLLGEHVYGTLGFRGNEADYYDPKNSLLSDVLERRLGIPITLAIVYCEVARRVGVLAHGVGFPGHFLVRVDQPGSARAGNAQISGRSQAPPVVVDPFFQGRILDEEAIERLLRRALGPAQPFRSEEHMAPAPAKLVLVRMLTNLKAIYLTRGDHARAHLAADRILLFAPNTPSVLRERGVLAARLGAHESAKVDLARALELDPEGTEAKAIRTELTHLERKGRALN
jgi:regulator of sirC expression with transglutaminase-like and TPR domain